jgi:hypothetical protein
MIGKPIAQASTGLSPEWDRWFDEEFTDLVTCDEDLVRQEFDALIDASWRPAPPPSPPAPPVSPPEPTACGGRRESEINFDDPAPGGADPPPPP